MELPTTPTRQELGKFLPSQRVIRAIEQLFEWIRLLGDPPFGEMYATNTLITVAVTAPSVAYEVTSGLTSKSLNYMSFGGNHYLVPEIAAKYLVTWSMSIDTATPLDAIEGGVMLNGVEVTGGTSHTTVPAGNSFSTISASTIVDAAALDQISLFIRNHTAARDISIEHASLTAVLLKAS